jgi:hypothetical protein
MLMALHYPRYSATGGPVAARRVDRADQREWSTPDDPVVSDNGEITAVGFNNEADVAAWVALNVKNPDIAFLLPFSIQTVISENDGYPLLPNTGVIQIVGTDSGGQAAGDATTLSDAFLSSI